jgi:glycosyltransferase involved in cell wall biosynthesis
MNGIVVPPKDPGAIAIAIEKLARNPELRDRLASEAVATMNGEFYVSRSIEKLVQVYEELVA